MSSPAATNPAVVFDQGNYSTFLRTVESSAGGIVSPPPKPLLIASPTEVGEFPVVIFLHGYLLYNSFYSKLIQHIASHGFILIAPQVRKNHFSLSFQTEYSSICAVNITFQFSTFTLNHHNRI